MDQVTEKYMAQKRDENPDNNFFLQFGTEKQGTSENDGRSDDTDYTSFLII